MIFASPVSQPLSVRHSASSPLPAARWMAPSTPPPPSNDSFAAFTIASTESILVISFSTVFYCSFSKFHIFLQSVKDVELLLPFLSINNYIAIQVYILYAHVHVVVIRVLILHKHVHVFIFPTYKKSQSQVNQVNKQTKKWTSELLFWHPISSNYDEEPASSLYETDRQTT